jgi:hypothetical protein
VAAVPATPKKQNSTKAALATFIVLSEREKETTANSKRWKQESAIVILRSEGTDGLVNE